MAKIIVTADTETKELIVDVEGEIQSNVNEVSFYLYPSYSSDNKNELHISIRMSEENEQTGITKTTHLMAKDSKEGKAALDSGASVHAKYRDFVILGDSNKLKKDIAKYFLK